MAFGSHMSENGYSCEGPTVSSNHVLRGFH